MTPITPEEAEAMVALKEPFAIILKEFGRGCSESGKNPADCGMCLDAAVDAILAALARLREADRAEIERLTRERDDWRSNFRALEKAVVGETGLSAMTVAAQAMERQDTPDYDGKF